MYKVAIVILSALLLGIAGFAFAGTTGGPTGGGGGGGGGGTVISFPNPFNCQNFGCIIEKIINALLIIGAPIATLMVIVGGFQIMGSPVDPEKLKRGWKTVLWTCGGYGLLLIANAVDDIIVSFV